MEVITFPHSGEFVKTSSTGDFLVEASEQGTTDTGCQETGAHIITPEPIFRHTVSNYELAKKAGRDFFVLTIMLHNVDEDGRLKLSLSALSAEAGVPRRSLYRAIERLKNKDLVEKLEGFWLVRCVITAQTAPKECAKLTHSKKECADMAQNGEEKCVTMAHSDENSDAHSILNNLPEGKLVSKRTYVRAREEEETPQPEDLQNQIRYWVGNWEATFRRVQVPYGLPDVARELLRKFEPIDISTGFSALHQLAQEGRYGKRGPKPESWVSCVEVAAKKRTDLKTPKKTNGHIAQSTRPEYRKLKSERRKLTKEEREESLRAFELAESRQAS